MNFKSLSATEALQIFNKSVRENNANAARNIGLEILQRGSKEYPESILISVRMQLNNISINKRSLLSIYSSLPSDDKSLIEKICPKLIRDSLVEQTPVNEYYKAFNKYNNHIEDLWITDCFMLNIRCLESFNSKFYQGSFTNLGFVEELSLINDLAFEPGYKILKIKLINPFMPVIIIINEQSMPSNDLSEVYEIIPFPSILRGGMHYCELVAKLPDCKIIEALHRFHRFILSNKISHRLTNISYSFNNSDFSAVTSSRDWVAWMEEVHDISMKPPMTTDYSLIITLHLDTNSYPSLELILLGFVESQNLISCHRKKILVVNSPTSTPKKIYSLCTPKSINENVLQDLPFFSYNNSNTEIVSNNDATICIMYNDLECINKNPTNSMKSLNCSSSNNKYLIVVELESSIDLNAIKRFLVSLYDQQNLVIKEIALLSSSPINVSLNELILNLFSLNPLYISNLAELYKESDFLYDDCIVIFASQYLVFQQIDLISTLSSYISCSDIATISCGLELIDFSRKNSPKIGNIRGFYPRDMDLASNHEIQLTSPPVFQACKKAKFNVMVNNLEFMLSRSKDFVKFKHNLNSNYYQSLADFSLDCFLNYKFNLIDTNFTLYLQRRNRSHLITVDTNQSKVFLNNYDQYKDNYSLENNLLP